MRGTAETTPTQLNHVMRLYAAAGQPAAALRQYRELERVLRQELGATPDPTTCALARGIEQQAAGDAISAPNQSPFNVGTRLVLEDFTIEQVADLNRRYRCPLRNETVLGRFFSLLNGQPYLVRLGLHQMATQEIDLAALEAQAQHDRGIFGDHLRRLQALLVRDPEVCEVMRGVLQGQPCPTDDSFYRLRSAGLLVGETSRDARPRCRLYARYLERHLR